MFDAVKYAENNYQKFYNDIPDNLIKKYDIYRMYFINSICEANDDNNAYGYAVTFGGTYLYQFYKEYNSYPDKLYTFQKVYNNLKKLKEENK